MASDNTNVWVQFWDKDEFDSSHHHGTYASNSYFEVSDLEDVDWPNTGNKERNDYSSLKTGNNTWLTVYSDTEFGGDSHTFGPNSSIGKLSDVKRSSLHSWENCINSYKVFPYDPSQS